MGKWMLGYHDDVLRDKFKSMVESAIKRLQMEKGELSITYEAFVTDLDLGDSFTSSLIDILVKELADRRKRANPLDRKLISENTAQALRTYGERARPHRERPSSSFGLGRTTTIDYPFPIADIDHLDDEEESSELPETQYLSSIRAANEAYGREPWSYAETEPLILSPPPNNGRAIERVTSPLPVSPPPRPWVPSALLHRQNSIRRPTRSRTLDFSEFTTRRRGQQRATTQATASSDSPRPEESADGTWRFHSRLSSGSLTSSGSSNRLQFLPMAALVDPQYQAGEGSSSPGEQRPPVPHHSYPHPHTSGLSTSGPLGNPYETISVPPRLRRGGLRAPESLLQRQPRSESTTSSLVEANASAVTLPPQSTSTRLPSSSLGEAIERLQASSAEEAPSQLLTPRSISPADDNNV